MSGDLDRAVDDRIASHTPDLVPPFETLLARKRSRDRRRAGAAVLLSAAAVLGIAVLPGFLTGSSGGPPAIGPAASAPALSGSTTQFTYTVRADASARQDGQAPDEAGVQPCLQNPGLFGPPSSERSSPPQYSGRLEGRAAAEELQQCVAAAPGWAAQVAPVEQLPVRTYTLRSSNLLVLNAELDEQRDACLALPGVRVAVVRQSEPPSHLVRVLEPNAKEFEQCLSGVLGLSVPELRPPSEPPPPPLVQWTGAQLCTDASPARCRDLDAEQADELQRVLDRAVPTQPGDVFCEATSTVYRVQFQHPSVRAVPYEVPLRCGPVLIGQQQYDLADDDRDAVRRAYETGQPFEQADVPPAPPAAYTDCVGQETATAAGAYVGLTEEQAEQQSAEDGVPLRVVGRDGQCQGRDDDRQPARVNITIDDGAVTWAGRF